MVGRATGARILGRTLGHYRIVEQVDAGGMGEIYRAFDEHLNRDVAIKVLPVGTFQDESTRKRFRREALALSRLNHANIATVFDFDTQGGVDFLVMEFVEGAPAHARLPEREVIELGKQLADGLAAAHSQGVIHRDLKPRNLRVTPDHRLKILDFGLAKLARSPQPDAETASLTETQHPVGTLPYMAPEQLQGEGEDARSDIWAAGAVLYEMATGQRPFPESGPRLVAQILQQPPQPPGSINRRMSPELENIVLKCLEKDPGNRYQSALELSVDLHRLALGSAVIRPLPGRRRGTLRSRLLLGGIGCVVVIAALAGLWAGRWRERLFGPADERRIESLAVLPLVNLSKDPEQEYFAEGMTDQLITDLSRIGALKVISRSSAVRYKGTSKTVPQIARELGVGAVVQGSVLRSGDRVRISVQLTDGRTDENLWGQSYERELRDVLALQEEVATEIAGQIRAKLTPGERAYLSTGRTVDTEAYQLYLKGRFFWNQRTPEGFRQARVFFEQAIQRDPRFAEAYAGLADTYVLMGDYGLLSPREARPKANAAAQKALELDERLAEAHTSLAGILESHDWDWAGAEKEYRRAIELNPNYATAHQWYGTFLSTMARHEEAIAQEEKAAELAPVSPRILTDLGYAWYWAGQYREAAEQCRKILQIAPDFAPAHELLGWAYLQQDAHADALQEFHRFVVLSGDSPAARASLAYAYARAGDPAEARRILAGLQSGPGRESAPPYQMALVYTGLGENQKALESLRKALQGEHDKWLLFIKVEPAFAPLHSYPQFGELLRRMNMPP